MAVEARDFDRRFVGFAARVAEERFLHARDRREPVGEPLLELDFIEVGGVDQPACLRSDRLDQPRVAVAESAHRDPGERIEIAFAMRVPYPDAGAALERNRQPFIGVHHVRHKLSVLKNNTAAVAAVVWS